MRKSVRTGFGLKSMGVEFVWDGTRQMRRKGTSSGAVDGLEAISVMQQAKQTHSLQSVPHLLGKHPSHSFGGTPGG